MKIYLNGSDAVSDLHRNGFTNDFQLFGNDLLWVQENILIRPNEFAILEYHRIIQHNNDIGSVTVFGIVALYHNVKGILVNCYKGYLAITPPGLVNALNKLRADAGMITG